MNSTIKNLAKRIFGLELYERLRRWRDYRRHYRTGNFSRYGIDKILEEMLPHRDGFYVELGANDGAGASNSYYFELNKGWKGVLISRWEGALKSGRDDSTPLRSTGESSRCR